MGRGYRRASSLSSLALLALACVLVSSSAAAQSDEDRATARAAATQGLAQEEAGKWSEAIELFRRAEAIIHAPPHLVHIARAEEKLGRLVAARETYLKVTREELSQTAPRAFVDAQADAQKELAALEPRIPTLKVVVEGGAASVTLDGSPMPDALIGIDRPIDPGNHELRAKGEAGASKPVTVTVAEGAHETARLVLDASYVPDELGSGTAVPARDGAPKTTGGSKGMRIGAYVGWGVGAAGVAVGTIMLVVNHGKRSDADALCPNGACPLSRRADVEALDADADSAATLSWVGYGVGVVGLGVGTALFFMSRDKSDAPSPRAAITPWLGVGAAGVRGRF